MEQRETGRLPGSTGCFHVCAETFHLGKYTQGNRRGQRSAQERIAEGEGESERGGEEKRDEKRRGSRGTGVGGSGITLTVYRVYRSFPTGRL